MGLKTQRLTNYESDMFPRAPFVSNQSFSIPSQGPCHTKDVIKMVPVVRLFSTEHPKGKILALSEEL